MLVIGLTGGIATGKSTVAALLRDRGIPVVDADLAARAVVEPGQPALRAIVEAFGPAALLPDGRLDRAAMRARIIADPSARKTLERITHPAIAAWIADELQQVRERGAPVAFVEAALMVETESYRAYPQVWVVACDPATQLARLTARDGMSVDDAQKLIATQLPIHDKVAVADVVIHNDGTPEELRAEVARLLREQLGIESP